MDSWARWAAGVGGLPESAYARCLLVTEDYSSGGVKNSNSKNQKQQQRTKEHSFKKNKKGKKWEKREYDAKYKKHHINSGEETRPCQRGTMYLRTNKGCFLERSLRLFKKHGSTRGTEKPLIKPVWSGKMSLISLNVNIPGRIMLSIIQLLWRKVLRGLLWVHYRKVLGVSTRPVFFLHWGRMFRWENASPLCPSLCWTFLFAIPLLIF